MKGLGLSAEALERRRGYVVASDAADIMAGNWPLVYGRKTSKIAEDDLSRVLAPMLGSYTEPFCLTWYMQETGRPVVYFTDSTMLADIWRSLSGRVAQAEFQVSKEYPFMGCSLDAMSTTSRGFSCVLDAKHVGTFNYNTLVERYLPAMTHQAIVKNVDHWALAVLIGNSKFEVIEQEVDIFYRERLIAREREFWSWIEAKAEPPDMREPVPPPPPQPRLRSITMPMFTDPGWQDFAQRNNWAVPLANEIATFAETFGGHKAHMASRDKIKDLIPEDAGELRRGDFLAKRSRANALTMTIDREDK